MALIVSLLTLLGISSAYAYNLEGYRWGGTPSSGCCANLYYNEPSDTGWVYGVDKDAMHGAESAWNNSPANVYYVNNGSPNISFNDTVNSSVNWDGITYYSWNSDNTFAYANAYVNGYYLINYPSWVSQGVAAHELGHVLGLAHSNGCVLMVPDTPDRQSCGISGPTQDDVNGANALY